MPRLVEEVLERTVILPIVLSIFTSLGDNKGLLRTSHGC